MEKPRYLFFITAALVAVSIATLGFAQEDNVTIKRTAGDFYDITIPGERNGDLAEVQLVRTETHSWRFSKLFLAGIHPSWTVYALVVSGGNENAKSSYSMTFQEELSGPAWEIAYYVTDNYNDFVLGNFDYVRRFSIHDYYTYDSHFNEGYYFDVNLIDSSFEPQPEGVVKIYNLKVEGFEDPFWAIFQWNPRNLNLELKGAGREN